MRSSKGGLENNINSIDQEMKAKATDEQHCELISKIRQLHKS